MNNEYFVVHTSFNGLEVMFIVSGEFECVKQFVERNTLISRITAITPEVAKMFVDNFGMKIYYAPNWDIQPLNYAGSEEQTVEEGE